jgi:5-methylthioadenosine/S-adenosylhomocysteine deaminase
LRDAGVFLTLSLDTLPLGGVADPFAAMRLMAALERAERRDEFALSASDLLRMSTTDGARALGLGDEVGMLRPGMRADLVGIRTGTIALSPVTDPASLVIGAATPADVDIVVAGGVVLKEDGRLTRVDEDRLAAQAQEAWRSLRDRA